jgi:rhomboid protease GluP
MNLNQLLVWMVGLSCGIFLFQTLRVSNARAHGWTVVCAAILALVGILLYVQPDRAGWIGGLLWLIFFVAPLVASRRVNQLFCQEQYERAFRLARLVCWLHPADGWREQAELLQAVALSQTGQFDRAVEILQAAGSPHTALGRSATAIAYWMDADWLGMLGWLRTVVPDRTLRTSPDLMTYYLRSLGETGDLNGMLQELEAYDRRIRQPANDANRLYPVRLYALAFCGQVEQVQWLFDRLLALYPLPMRQFWLATAQLAAGDTQSATVQLQTLSPRADRALQGAIAWRLSHPPVLPQHVLTPDSIRYLQRLSRNLQHEAQYGMTLNRPAARATQGLIACNIAVFGLATYLGGSANPHVLFELGALVPELAWHGEWWRLVSSTFLHLGLSHLTMNMLGLYVLGSYVESALGIWRYLLVYAVSGVGSMGIVTLLSIWEKSPVDFVVGASGAIMGLIGAIAATLLYGWRKDKAKVARERLRAMAMIIVLQTLFDWLNPQICFVCHSSGLILGFLTAWLLVSDRDR